MASGSGSGSGSSNNQVDFTEARRVVPVNTYILISNFKICYNLSRRPDGTINRNLDEFLERKTPACTIPFDGVYSFDLVDRVPNLVYRLYKSAPTNQALPSIIFLEKPLSTTEIVPVILFFHGGSFAHSSNNTAIYDTFCRRLVKICKAVVVSVDYRLSPEYRYPCAYADGWAALNWVHSRNWLKSGRDCKAHVYLAGDSSGGNIAHHVAVRAAESGVEVQGSILLHPFFGGQERKDSETRLDGRYFMTLKDRDWYWKAFLPVGEDRDHPACNIFGPRSQSIKGLQNFPKSLVCVAGFDLCQDWQLAYVEGLKEAGHEVELLYLEQATIGYYFLPNIDHFYVLMDKINEFVNQKRF